MTTFIIHNQNPVYIILFLAKCMLISMEYSYKLKECTFINETTKDLAVLEYKLRKWGDKGP